METGTTDETEHAPGVTAHPLRVQIPWRGRPPLDVVAVTRPGPWGNPYAVRDLKPGFAVFDLDKKTLLAIFATRYEANAKVVSPYTAWLTSPAGAELLAEIDKLRGRKLGCVCDLDMPCHGNVLAWMANASPPE